MPLNTWVNLSWHLKERHPESLPSLYFHLYPARIPQLFWISAHGFSLEIRRTFLWSRSEGWGFLAMLLLALRCSSQRRKLSNCPQVFLKTFNLSHTSCHKRELIFHLLCNLLWLVRWGPLYAVCMWAKIVTELAGSFKTHYHLPNPL